METTVTRLSGRITVLSRIPGLADHVLQCLQSKCGRGGDSGGGGGEKKEGGPGPAVSFSVCQIDLSYGGGDGGSTSAAAADDISKAEVLLADPDLLVENHAYLTPACRWVQGTWAGVDRIVSALRDAKCSPPPWPLTRFGGFFGPAMSDYVLGGILMHERHFGVYAREQVAGLWRPDTSVIDGDATTPIPRIRAYSPLTRRSVAVLGMGDIGRHVARACLARGMRVRGVVRRHPSAAEHTVDGVEYQVGALDGLLPSALAACDYVVNVLPSTSSTRGALTLDVLRKASQARRLAQKEEEEEEGGVGDGAHAMAAAAATAATAGPYFINVGRGDLATHDNLWADAVDEGLLSGCLLDVFNAEPPPKSCRLWTHPRVTMTPHIAAVSFPEEVAAAFTDNYMRYTSGGPGKLKYAVDFEAGY